MTGLFVREPAVAGQFYPASPTVLRGAIDDFIDSAQVSEGLGAVRAVIAPHAGYIYSGPTAGYAFKALSSLPPKSWTVFLMGPAHRAYVRGVALGSYSAFHTPLGDAEVDTERVDRMLSRSSLYTRAPESHDPEHSLEVEVPFLQASLDDFRLVPMLFGEVDPTSVAEDLAPHLNESDLVVVSSDLSHFYSYENAQQLDRALLRALEGGDQAGVLQGEACGRAPIAALMGIASRKQWVPHVLDYRNSGDTAGDKFRVVGYASVAYTQ
jgi:AmmeMemoRadiSam system protein B